MHPATRPLRIVHVDAEGGFSGGERQVFLLLEGLRARGHESLLVCPPGSCSESEARARHLAHRPVRMRNDLDAAAVVRLAREIRRAGPDLVHLHTGRAAWLGALAARAAHVPALATRRMDRPLAPSARVRWLHGRALAATVAISRPVAEQLAAAGVPAERVRVIPSAVDPRALRPGLPREAVRRALGAGSEAVLLTAAALVRRKGLDVLLEALARLCARGHPVRLWIAGEGPLRGALEAHARSLGVDPRVAFLGRREDVPDLLAACDVFVLPSRQEGLGVAALEAMAVGRPVVASAVGGLADAVVPERTGLLVPPGDPEALASALERVVGDPGLRARLGAEGPPHIARTHHADRMVEAYEALYRELLAAS